MQNVPGDYGPAFSRRRSPRGLGLISDSLLHMINGVLRARSFPVSTDGDCHIVYSRLFAHACALWRELCCPLAALRRHLLDGEVRMRWRILVSMYVKSGFDTGSSAF